MQTNFYVKPNLVELIVQLGTKVNTKLGLPPTTHHHPQTFLDEGEVLGLLHSACRLLGRQLVR